MYLKHSPVVSGQRRATAGPGQDVSGVHAGVGETRRQVSGVTRLRVGEARTHRHRTNRRTDQHVRRADQTALGGTCNQSAGRADTPADTPINASQAPGRAARGTRHWPTGVQRSWRGEGGARHSSPLRAGTQRHRMPGRMAVLTHTELPGTVGSRRPVYPHLHLSHQTSTPNTRSAHSRPARRAPPPPSGLSGV